LGQLDRGTGQFFASSLGLGQFFSSDFFQFRTAGFKLLDGIGGGAAGAARWDQEIAGIAIFDLDDFTEIAKVDHLVEQYDLHVVTP